MIRSCKARTQMTANPHGIEHCATGPEAESQLELETEVDSKPAYIMRILLSEL